MVKKNSIMFGYIFVKSKHHPMVNDPAASVSPPPELADCLRPDGVLSRHGLKKSALGGKIGTSQIRNILR